MSRVCKILLVLWTLFVVVIGFALAARLGDAPDHDADSVAIAGTSIAISLAMLWCIGGVPLSLLALVFAKNRKRRTVADAV